MNTERRILAGLLSVLLALGMSVGGAGAAMAHHNDNHAGGPPQDTGVKVFVCKYVGTPGVDERLQTGNNPISVSVNAIPDYQGVGSYFADAQGRSFVLAEDTRTGGGQEGEPSVSECPAPDGPTDVFPAAAATQYACVDEEVVGGFITVDLSVPGVSYSIEDSDGAAVAFDLSTGRTSALDAGNYTVSGVDADGTDTYSAAAFQQVYTIDGPMKARKKSLPRS